MSLRIYSVIFSGLLAGCGGPPEGVAPGNTSETVAGTPAEAPAEHVACAVGGAEFNDACTVDRAAVADGVVLTIRHPDGGFRRLRVSADGRSVTAADGAEPVTVATGTDNMTEVAVGDARYRLPLPR